MNAGISGHQVISPPDAVLWVTEIINELVDNLDVSLGLTSLAIGSDQLFAQVLLAKRIPFSAIIPCSGYESTFRNEDDLHSYYFLRDAAREVVQLPFNHPTPRAFLHAGRTVVDRSDFLVAVWDALPAQGVGGTAEIVSYCQSVGKRVIHINPLTHSIKTL